MNCEKITAQSVIDYVEEWIPVSIPKRVEIHNFRLGILLWLLRICILVYIGVLMWNGRPWRLEVSPVGTNSFWAQVDEASYQAAQGNDTARDFCDPEANKQYEFQYDAAGRYRYADLGCVNLPFNELFVKGESELYLPTFFEENTTMYRNVGGSGSSSAECVLQCADLEGCQPGLSFEFKRRSRGGACQCECVSSADSFVTGVEEVQIAFEHDVQVHKPDGQEEQFRWDEGLVTVVWDAKEQRELKRFESGQLVALSVREMLEFTGSSLGNFVKTSENRIPGANPQPIVRMTGVEILAKLTYHNTGLSGHTTEWNKPVCLFELTAREGWNSRPVTDWFASPDTSPEGVGSYRYKYNYGIRVNFVASGQFSYFDPTQFFFFLASVIVYLQVPGIIVTYLLWYGLGDLSNIYYLASNQKVAILELFQGLLARSLQAKYAFESRVFTETALGKTEGLAAADKAPRQRPAPGIRNVLSTAMAGVKAVALPSGSPTAEDAPQDSPRRMASSVEQSDAGSVIFNNIVEADIYSLFKVDQATGDEEKPKEVEIIGNIEERGREVRIMRGLVQGHHMHGGGGATDRTSVQDFITASTNMDPATLKDLVGFLKEGNTRNPLRYIFESRRRVRGIEKLLGKGKDGSKE